MTNTSRIASDIYSIKDYSVAAAYTLVKEDYKGFQDGRFVNYTKNIFNTLENILDAIEDIEGLCDILLITKKKSLRERFSELAEKIKEYGYDAILGDKKNQYYCIGTILDLGGMAEMSVEELIKYKKERRKQINNLIKNKMDFTSILFFLPRWFLFFDCLTIY